MNTKGHEDVANTAGRPLLEEVFGKDNPSLQAFYLGNWLTDVSQAIDPVAYQNVAEWLEPLIRPLDDLIEQVLGTIFLVSPDQLAEFVLQPLKQELMCFNYPVKQNFFALIEWFLGSTQDNERGSGLAKFLRYCILVVGYCKFVHPEIGEQKPRMDFECFMQVFGRPEDTQGATTNSPANDRPGAFTQYYPHEHLDRPECLPSSDPPVFAPGPQTLNHPFHTTPETPPGMRSTRSPHYRQKIEPDLYSYLRDDIEMTAGLLAEVDWEFKRVFEEGLRDNDPQWHITLAKLGHALHQVEDFFAHSNWVELAVSRLGKDFIKKSLIAPPEVEACLDALPLVDKDKFLNEYKSRAYTIFQRRLQRYIDDGEDRCKKDKDNPNCFEDWVVTGFFDKRDTFISLAHISEELWGGHVPDPFAPSADYENCLPEKKKPGQTVAEEVKKTIRNTLEFLTNCEKALQDRDNQIAQSDKVKDLCKKLTIAKERESLEFDIQSQKVAQQVIKESEYLSKAPKPIQEAFVNVIYLGSTVVKIGQFKTSIFEALNEIGKFFANPIEGLVERLLGWSPIWLQNKLKEAVIFYGKEPVYDMIGANRIGCHSLLAKDHGLEPLYKYQNECATAVHWYIVKTLLRWSSGENNDYIDWLELLEYFLRNPLPSDGSSYREEVTYEAIVKEHIVKKGEQLRSLSNPIYSLEHIYKPTAIDPQNPTAKDPHFTWRTIADFNFKTYGMSDKKASDVINQILKDEGWGVPVKKQNYAFKQGIRILIPNQKGKLVQKIAFDGEPQWWEEVMNKGWKVFVGYEDEKTETSYSPLQPHSPIEINESELKKLMGRGKCLRMNARESYRPDNNVKSLFCQAAQGSRTNSNRIHNKPRKDPSAPNYCLPLLAEKILNHPNITLAKTHSRSKPDNATPYQNIKDTMMGELAALSPGAGKTVKRVQLDARLLRALLTLAESYRYSISEIAGGVHSKKSLHYVGTAVDINIINGKHVSKHHREVIAFMRTARDLGAIEILGPLNDEKHATHVHLAWPLTKKSSRI